MESQDKPKSRLTEELESLRRQISELQKLVIEPALAQTPTGLAAQPSPASGRDAYAAVQGKLGFVPPFLLPGLHIPPLLETLSQQMLSDYLDNPIPGLTKEKLFVRLSRSCPVIYATVSHSCILKHLGMSAAGILEWLEQPLPAPQPDLTRCSALFASTSSPIPDWPESGTELEGAILRSALAVFLELEGAGRCRNELRDLLGPLNYARLLAFLGYVRTHFLWLQAYPELPYESDEYIRSHLTSLLADEPRLSALWRAVEIARPPEETGAGTGPPSRAAALREFLEFLPLGAALIDREYRLVQSNAALRAILGDSATAPGSLLEFVHGDDIQRWTAAVQLALSGTTPPASEGRIRKADGAPGWMKLTTAPLGDTGAVPCCLALFEDVSPQLKEQERLLTRKRFAERLLVSSRDGVFGFDPEGVLSAWNGTMEALFNLPEAEALGKRAIDAVPFLVRAGGDRCVAQALLGENVAFRDAHRVAPNLPDLYLDVRLGPVRDEAGQILGGFGVISDISELREAADARRTTEERYRELFESAHDMMYTQDLQGNLTSINQAGERITGYSRAEALRLKFTDLVAPNVSMPPAACSNGRLPGRRRRRTNWRSSPGTPTALRWKSAAARFSAKAGWYRSRGSCATSPSAKEPRRSCSRPIRSWKPG